MAEDAVSYQVAVGKSGTIGDYETKGVTVESIAESKRVLRLLQSNIPDVLTEGVDFGYVKGIPGKIIRDSGAQNIINLFNAYTGDRKILHIRDDDTIAVVLEVYIINRGTGNVIATGVGAASTQETKHKYRWIDNPLEWGFTQTDIDSWPKKDTKVEQEGKEEGVIKYKIKNPEHAELLNIITAQASKRGEVDAVRSLPGVGTALRLLLDPSLSRFKRPAPVEKPDWKAFWAKVSEMGLSQDEVHQKLGVKSINDWLAQGKTLDEAITSLRGAGEAPRPPGSTIPPKQPPKQPPQSLSQEADKVTPDQVKNLGQLFHHCERVFGIKQAAVVKELGYSSQNDISETPWDCWLKIKGVMADGRQA